MIIETQTPKTLETVSIPKLPEEKKVELPTSPAALPQQ